MRFSHGQTIEWLKGYRLGKYGFIGKSWNQFDQDFVTDVLTDVGQGAGTRAAVQISRASTPIPLHVFYDSAAISNISNDELLSLYQFSSKFDDPEYIKDGNKYVTEENWENKPFVSIISNGRDIDRFGVPLTSTWRGSTVIKDGAVNPYDDVTRKDGGPQMPLANFAPASRENITTKLSRSFLTVPEVYSSRVKDILDPVTFTWNGLGSEPPISAPGVFAYKDTIKTTEEKKSTLQTNEKTEKNISGKININFSWKDIIASATGLPDNRDTSEGTKGKDLSAEVAGYYKQVLDKDSTEILNLTTEKNHEESRTITPLKLDAEVKWNEVHSMTFNEYYHKFKDTIIANPNSPAPELSSDGNRIFISGAEVTMSLGVPVISSRASVVKGVLHQGQVLGQVWQGFRAFAGKDYLFTSNPSASAIHKDAAGDPTEISKFVNWLKEGGKNRAGSIYKNLEDLGMLKRLWGDDRSVRVNEGGGKEESELQLIRYIDDTTLEEVTTKPIETEFYSRNQVYKFEQTYNGKSLSQAVLDRYNQEVVAKGNTEPGNNTSPTLSNGSVESIKESGSDAAAYRSAFFPTGGHRINANTGHSKGTRSTDNFVIDPSTEIISSIDLRKDHSSDTIVFGGTEDDTTGHLNIINFDPSRDTLTGELVDSLAWSYDPVYHVVRGVSESEKDSSIQQARERALNGDALLVNIYLPFGRFKERDGKIVESGSKGYDVQGILGNLNGSDFGSVSGIDSGLTVNPLLAASF